MSLISCKINFILTWSANCVTSEVNRATTFAITDTKLYVPVEKLSNNDNVKLLDQLKSYFQRTINWDKYHSKVIIQQQPIFRLLKVVLGCKNENCYLKVIYKFFTSNLLKLLQKVKKK